FTVEIRPLITKSLPCLKSALFQDPVFKILFSNVYQNVCMYQDFYYKTFKLPDCSPSVDPTVTYPVALSCHCGRCAMATSDCTFGSLQPNFCIHDIPFYIRQSLDSLPEPEPEPGTA
uniref:Gonadotropin subunit beta-2 n=1 Tax=Sander lucioperca TaxID=283035 RepID=A0A8C9Y240_SANLU